MNLYTFLNHFLTGLGIISYWVLTMKTMFLGNVALLFSDESDDRDVFQVNEICSCKVLVDLLSFSLFVYVHRKRNLSKVSC